MPQRPHARCRGLPLACALACALLVGTLALVRRQQDVAGTSDARRTPDAVVPDHANSRIGHAAPGHPRTAQGGRTSAGQGPPRWIGRRGHPEIPRGAIRDAGTRRAEAVDFSFHGGRLRHQARVTRVIWRSEENFTLLGELRGERSDGSWALSQDGEVVVANFRLPDDGPYLEWRLSPDGSPEEREVLADLLPPCDAGSVETVAMADDRDPGAAKGARPPAKADDGAVARQPQIFGDDPVAVPELAILVVYTPAAVDAVGGHDAMEALVYLAIDETNAALADSLARPRVRLAHHQMVDYTETGDDLRADLSRLRIADDGFVDEVHALRDGVGADLVSMIVANEVSCGLAYTLTSNPAGFGGYAFSVVAQDCVATNYSFSHEIAHNLGCQHAAGDDNGAVVQGQGIFPYAHGWRFNATTIDNTLYRTIMAQWPGIRIPYYSNPDVIVAGAASGSRENADCVRTINATAQAAVFWRDTPDTLFGDAVGQPDWLFESGGDAPWTVQPIERRDGGEALQGGFVPDDGTSWLQTVRHGPVQIDFYWKSEFDDPGAALAVSVDGREYARIAGDTPWRHQMVRLATGSHIIRWTQTRGNAGNAVDAMAWLDAMTAAKVPLEIRRFRIAGPTEQGFELEFESIPFQDYLLEGSTDFRQWNPLRAIVPDQPLARRTVIGLASPQPVDGARAMNFRIRLVE